MKTSQTLLGVRIPNSLADRLRALAEKERRTISAQMTLILEKALTQVNEKDVDTKRQ